MGLFYTNVTLKGPSQDQVVAYLQREKRSAFVSPTIDAITVVYDRECEDQDTDALEALAANLSREVGCTALAALLHDDDVFWYALYLNGVHADEYNSDPAYFEDSEPEPPSGGDARIVCAAFGAETAEAAVETILRHWGGPDEEELDEYLMASERHQDLAHALGFPRATWAYSMGYDAIEGGYLPAGIDVAQYIRTSR